MKTLFEIKKILEQEKNYLLKSYGIKKIGIFGSRIREEEKPESDIDILIELEKPIKIDLLKLIETELELSEKLEKSLKPKKK